MVGSSVRTPNWPLQSSLLQDHWKQNALLGRTTVEEVVLDVEVALNNHPLTYLDEDIQLLVLTSDAMLHIDSNHLTELQPRHLPEKDLRKRGTHKLETSS